MHTEKEAAEKLCPYISGNRCVVTGCMMWIWDKNTQTTIQYSNGPPNMPGRYETHNPVEREQWSGMCGLINNRKPYGDY